MRLTNSSILPKSGQSHFQTRMSLGFGLFSRNFIEFLNWLNRLIVSSNRLWFIFRCHNSFLQAMRKKKKEKKNLIRFFTCLRITRKFFHRLDVDSASIQNKRRSTLNIYRESLFRLNECHWVIVIWRRLMKLIFINLFSMLSPFVRRNSVRDDNDFLNSVVLQLPPAPQIELVVDKPHLTGVLRRPLVRIRRKYYRLIMCWVREGRKEEWKRGRNGHGANRHEPQRHQGLACSLSKLKQIKWCKLVELLVRPNGTRLASRLPRKPKTKTKRREEKKMRHNLPNGGHSKQKASTMATNNSDIFII